MTKVSWYPLNAARGELAVALGGGDHREADAILDRATGVVALELQEELTRPGVEALDLHHWRVPDETEDIRSFHAEPSLLGAKASRGEWRDYL